MSLKRVVLVGAGHAHLHLAKHAAAIQAAGAEVVLIDPGSFWYSGLATGVLAGQYACELDALDPQSLIERNGGRFVRSSVKSIDTTNRTLKLADQQTLDWDIVSLNVGSAVSTAGIRGAEHAVAVKPIRRICELRTRLEQSHTGDGPLRACVIGAGATGCELALTLDGLARRHGWEPAIAVIAREGRLLHEFPRGAQEWMKRHLDMRRIRVVDGEANTITTSCVTLASGESMETDITLLATGLRAPHLTRSLNLPAGGDGLHVNAFLHSPETPSVFATGDCAAFLPRKLPKLGVFGVRQAPFLLHNIVATLRNETLKPYAPQSRYLAILNLGNGDALGRWGNLWFPGRTMMRLKNHLDMSFLAKYRP